MERLSPRLGRVAFALPCNTDAVFAKLTERRVLGTSPESRRQRAIRTSWRILKDWVEAQMALLETGMVTMDEIFLPYILSGGQTLRDPPDLQIWLGHDPSAFNKITDEPVFWVHHIHHLLGLSSRSISLWQ